MLGPAAYAACRQSADRAAARRRAYPAPLMPEDGTGDSAVLAATRALLAVTTRADAAHVLRTAIHDLGGAVVPARLAETNPAAGHVDVSLGAGEPQLVVSDPLSMAGMRLTHHLPGLVQDALTAAARCDDLMTRIHLDELTGLPTGHEITRRIDAAGRGDIVCTLGLDGLDQLNDRAGQGGRDAELQDFARLLRERTRPGDACARYGGDAFFQLFVQLPVHLALGRMKDMVRAWAGRAGHGTTVSVGVARVGATGTRALADADRARDRAKQGGRYRVVVASPVDDV